MQEIVIISGKGGTGKTTVAAAFATLAENKIMADCDVDAADLHLILDPKIKQQEEFRSGKTAHIREKDCISCGKCRELCQFDAINSDFVVDAVSCEGCGVCVWFCPEKAIDFNENLSGHWFISETRFGPMVHARLGIAEENSGKLVSLVRREARRLAEEQKRDYIIVDGAPGVGCPVISSITNADKVLVITEPTLSGLHDLERVVSLAVEHFHINTYVCVNKFDLNSEMSEHIRKFCDKKNIDFVGKIPYDNVVTKAMVQGLNVIEYSDSAVVPALRQIWSNMFINSK